MARKLGSVDGMGASEALDGSRREGGLGLENKVRRLDPLDSGVRKRRLDCAGVPKGDDEVAGGFDVEKRNANVFEGRGDVYPDDSSEGGERSPQVEWLNELRA